MPPSVSFFMTGLTSSMVSTRSPITMPLSPILERQPATEREAGLQFDAVKGDLQVGARKAHPVDAAGGCCRRLAERLPDPSLPVVIGGDRCGG
jgi:hypothetical protein